MIGIFGAGAFGTAMAALLHSAHKAVVLWGRNPKSLAQIAQQRRCAYLQNQILPKGMNVSTNLAQLAQCDSLLLAIPTQKLRDFLQQNPLPDTQARLVICAKGIEQKTALLPSQVVQSFYPHHSIQVLSGPAFAADLVAGLPTAMSLGGTDEPALRETQQQLSNQNLRLYTSKDPIGMQLCGAFKNVYAIGCGALMGAGLGDSAHAAFLSRAIAELRIICGALGGNAQTVYGLAGLGDLMLTGSRMQSRNYRYGFALGAGRRWDEDITVEGIPTAHAIVSLKSNTKAEMPIATQILTLIEGRGNVQDSLQALMQRDLRAE